MMPNHSHSFANPVLGNLSKEQIAALPEEQQEQIARVILDENRHRRKLIAKSKVHWGFDVMILIIGFCAFMSLWWLDLPKWALFLGLLFFALIQLHAFSTNRRIDAILELMNLEKNQNAEPLTNTEKSNDTTSS